MGFSKGLAGCLPKSRGPPFGCGKPPRRDFSGATIVGIYITLSIAENISLLWGTSGRALLQREKYSSTTGGEHTILF